MPKETCADNLARLGEMLTAAGEYSDRCGGTLPAEDRNDVEGAYQRIEHLRLCHAELVPEARCLGISAACALKGIFPVAHLRRPPPSATPATLSFPLRGATHSPVWQPAARRCL
jgi:hypothetical protein